MSALYIPQHGLNIDRESLPQVASKDVPDFIHWLQTHKHASIMHTELPVAALYPSQGNFNQSKIRAFMGKEKSNLKKPIIVSGDHFVLDGHHRWLALLNMDKNETIPVIMVHMKIMDLLAATKEYPKSTTKSIVESFKTIMEEKEKHAVLAFGRMNPPTTGHEKLVNKVHEVAKAHNASHEVVLSHSQDKEKNPLSQSQKLKHAKRFFPHTNITGASKEAPTLFHHAEKLHKQGVKHLHVVMGGDRVKEFHDALHKHNGKFDKEGHGYKFKSITVHSAGHRDPDAKGTEGMSASKMREHASKGNFHEFKKGIPSHVSHEHAQALYHDVRKGMGHLQESQELNEYMQVSSYRGAIGLHKVLPKGFKAAARRKKMMQGFTPTNFGMTQAEKDALVKKNQERDELLKYRGSKVIKEEVLSEGVHDAGIFKAVFLAGAPGSGKDFVLKKALTGHGLTEINSDHALEFLMDKHKLDKKMPEHEQDKRNVVRDKAKSLTELRQRLALQGRNGLVVNATGADPEKTAKIKKMLDELGYNSKMVFVDTSDNVSRQRNIERGQRGGRMIPEKIRAQKYREAQDARVKFSKLFGGEHYHEFNNDEDLRTNKDPEVHTQKHKELTNLFKTVRKFTQEPPQHPAAQEWIHKNLGKLAKQPIGNKQQQSSQPAPAPGTQAADEAKKMGLQYYGKGRYGKNGRVSHFSLNGKLIEKRKALTPPKPQEPQVKKAINEAFEELLTEEQDQHVDLRLRDHLEDHFLVGESEVQGAGKIFENFRSRQLSVPGLSESRTSIPAGAIGRNGSEGREAQEEEKESLVQENHQAQKVSFQDFRKRVGVLTEGEPVPDTGEEGGPILGMDKAPEEKIDFTNGGKATTKPGKFKRLQSSDLR